MLIRSNFLTRIQLPFCKDRDLYAALFSVLGFYPRHLKYYKQALVHKSIALAQGSGVQHNERLEFLGDAILEAITSDILYAHFPEQREGFLTNTRSKLVQRETLNKLAEETGLNNLIKTDNGTAIANTNVGGNAFEALVGAIYLDRGYDACMFFMKKRILKHLLNVDNVAAQEVNFKSKLIEWCQKRHYQLEFRLDDQKSEHVKTPWFETCIVINGIECERRRGRNKKESHQRAARATLIKIHHDRDYALQFKEASSPSSSLTSNP